MKSKWEFFTKEELKCRCGKCERGQDWMDQTFMENLVEIRRKTGVPMPLTSAYRCPEYNAKISKTGRTGPHTRGRAVDIRLGSRESLLVVAEALREWRMTGIGVSQKGSKRFLHLDDLKPDDGFPVRPNMWSY